MQGSKKDLADLNILNCGKSSYNAASYATALKAKPGLVQMGWGVKETTGAWQPVSNLGRFRGTVQGCVADGKVTKGKCSANTLLTGTDVPAHAAADLTRWRNDGDAKQNVMCVLRPSIRLFLAPG